MNSELLERIIVDEFSQIAKDQGIHKTKVGRKAFGDSESGSKKWIYILEGRKDRRPQSLTIADMADLCNALGVPIESIMFNAIQRCKNEEEKLASSKQIRKPA